MSGSFARSTLFVALSLCALTAPLAAQDRGHRGGPGHGPPPEALAACRAHVDGASCTFTDPRGQQVTGTCGAPTTSLPLACMPAGGPPGGPHARSAHRGPPPEALTACSGIDTGDACVVDTPRGDTLEGVCRATPQGTACVPDGFPPPDDDGASDAP